MDFETACLSYEPWDGGKGDDRYAVFSDRFVTTRKPHDCVICRDQIPVKSRVRARTEKCLDNGGAVMTFYCCPACCDAMAALRDGRDDRGFMIEGRYRLGMAAARAAA